MTYCVGRKGSSSPRPRLIGGEPSFVPRDRHARPLPVRWWLDSAPPTRMWIHITHAPPAHWAGRRMSLQHYRVIRQLRARPRLFIATAVAVAVGLFLPHGMATHPVTRMLVAWNAGAALYVAMAAVMMQRSTHHGMRRRAQLQDDGQVAILLLACIASVASIAAIAAELAVAKDIHGFLKTAHIALAGMTVVTSWAFIQVMFALHYAHDYYAAACHGRAAGLQFPNDEEPDYGDFFYAAAIVGTSGQTADVSYSTKPMRRIGSLHCILAYFFNTTVLALLINIAASLL